MKSKRRAARRSLAKRNRASAGLDRATIDALAAGLCVIDEEGRIVAVNRAWREFAAANGGHPARVSRSNYLAVCDAASASSEIARAAGEGIRAVLRSELGEFGLEYPCHSPEQQRWFAMRATRRSLAGRTGAVIVHTDVTERRIAIAALRAERDFIATVLETTSALIVVLDLQGRVLRFNRACEEATGYLSEEVEGRNFWELGLVPDEEVAQVRRATRDVLGGRGPVSIENHWRHRDGSLRRLAWTASLSAEAWGETDYIVGSAIDVTEARAAAAREQERLDELARLHRLHTAGEMAAMLAHELNQPLAAIANYAEAARRLIGNDGSGGARLRGIVERIAEQTLRAGRAIRELRASLTRPPRESARADPNEVARNAQRLTMPYAGTRNVEVTLELDDSVGEVAVDPSALDQILVNLIRNAVEAIAQGGMRGGTVIVRTQRMHDAVRISVEDNGPGVDPETAERMFTPFFTTKPSGLGLGLHISRTFAEAAGGRLWAEPHVPGAQVRLELPFAR